jgi:hypothetical protein
MKESFPKDSILSESLNGYPKHPEKVDLPLDEFCEFYFRSKELNHLSSEDRQSLAVNDMLASTVLLCRKVYSNSSCRKTDLFISKKEDYISKLLFLKDYLDQNVF